MDQNEMTLLKPAKDCAVDATTENTISELRFTVFGTPVPQGSTRAFIPKGWKRPIITAANAKTKPWRQEVAGAAITEIEKNGFRRIEGAVAVEAHFFFDQPKSVKGNQKLTKPDIDKLMRSLFDALTGFAFRDDSQITICEAFKKFGSPARCEVKISEVAE